jgi:hypothetical protein
MGASCVPVPNHQGKTHVRVRSMQWCPKSLTWPGHVAAERQGSVPVYWCSRLQPWHAFSVPCRAGGTSARKLGTHDAGRQGVRCWGAVRCLARTQCALLRECTVSVGACRAVDAFGRGWFEVPPHRTASAHGTIQVLPVGALPMWNRHKQGDSVTGGCNWTRKMTKDTCNTTPYMPRE